MAAAIDSHPFVKCTNDHVTCFHKIYCKLSVLQDFSSEMKLNLSVNTVICKAGEIAVYYIRMLT